MLLLFNMRLDGITGDCTNRRDERTPCPAGWQTLLEPRKLIPQRMGCVPLDLANNLVDARTRINIYACCLFSINSFRRIVTASDSTFRRYFGQRMTWY